MPQYIDLHTHSVYSEGSLTCQQLLKLAHQQNISVLSLTDHNVIDGLTEIINLSKQFGITVIPGVEIYTRYKGHGLHLLGYNFDLQKTTLADSLADLQKDHLQKVEISIKNLVRLGFKISFDDVLKNKSRYLGVIHILKELEKQPENVTKIKKALPDKHLNYFSKVFFYFGKGQSAYLPQSELPTEEAVDIIKKSGGLAVLAHPGQQLTHEQDNIIVDLAKAGLDGLEAISPYHNWHQIEHYQRLAQRNDLIITGGSDYHADLSPDKGNAITKQWDYFRIPMSVYEKLKNKLTKQ